MEHAWNNNMHETININKILILALGQICQGNKAGHDKEPLCLCEWQSSTVMKWHYEAQERFVGTILAVMAEACWTQQMLMG